MDQFDLAQDLDAYYRDQALALHRRKMAVTGEALTNCLACGDEIPEGRRAIQPGCTHCVACAAEIERERRR